MSLFRLQHRPAARANPATLPTWTDFGRLAGRRVLCVVDEDNLRVSIQAHHCRLSYRRLHQRLTDTCQSVATWAVLTSPANCDRRYRYLQRRGWRVIDIPQEIVATVNGPVKKANADMDLCFAAGSLLRRGQYQAVLVGSGDGDLAVAIARGVKRIRPRCAVFTLAVPGSASQRLRNQPDLFSGALQIGRDLTRSARSHPQPITTALIEGDYV